ncbi:MAG: efflux RND transporter periplasmic adaptor subunit [Melioribacteraceae bacterium]
MKNRKYIIILSGLAIVLFSFFSMKYLGGLKKSPTKIPSKENVRYVKAIPINYSNLTTELTASGRVYSQSEITISAEVIGKIEQGNVPFKKGQSFRKGDLLIKIEDYQAGLSLKAKKSSFLNRLAGILPDYKIDYSENYNSWLSFFESINIDEDLPDLPEIKSTKEKVFLASRNILSEYYSIKSEENRYYKHSIYAPFSGSIIQANVEVGAIANPGAMLGKIINTSNLELEVPLEIAEAKWVKIGDKVLVKNDNGSQQWKGTIIRKAKDIDPQTQSVSVFVKLYSKQSNPIYKGQYLTAVFNNLKLNDVMEIPRKAVFNSDEVFVVKDSLLIKKNVNVVKRTEETLFFNGLEENLNIVVEPLINASTNTKVKLLK